MFKIIIELFLISCIFVGANTLHYSQRKIDKLRFTYLAVGSLLSLIYVIGGF